MLFRTFAAAVLAVAGAAILVLLLPTLLSSSFIQQLLHPGLEAAMERTVEWEKLSISWRQGIRLTNLRLGDGAAPLRRVHIEEMETSFGVARSEIRPLLVVFSLRLSGLAVEMEPSPERGESQPAEGEINPEEILAGIAAKLRESVDLGWEIPVDLQIMIEVGPATLHYRDPGTGEAAAVEDLHFALKLPSLLSAPINATSAADLVLNGDHRLESFRFAADLSDLADGGRLRPAGARINLEAEFPGFNFQLQGSMAETGLLGEVRLQPSLLLPVIQPFVVEPLPRVTGVLSATLEGEIAGTGDLLLGLAVQAEELTISGGPLAEGLAGPLSFTLKQQGATDHRRDTVSLTAGELLVPGIMEFYWQAAVERPLSPNRHLTASLGPLAIHLPPLLELAKPFLPADLPLISVHGRLECDSLEFSAGMEIREGDVSLQGLRLLLDRFTARLPPGEITGRDLRLEVTRAGFPLVEGFPGSAQVGAGWRLRSLQVRGGQPLTLADLAGHVDISVEELKKQPASRFGVSARLAVEQQLSLSSLRLPEILELTTIEEKLQLGVDADAQGDLKVDLRSFAVKAEGRPVLEGKLLPVLAVDLQAHGAEVRLAENTVLPQVRDFNLRLHLNPGVHLATLTEIAPEGNGTVRNEGRLAVDVTALAAWAKALLPSGVDGRGKVDFIWRAGIKLPESGFPDPGVINPLRQARQALDLLMAAELTLNLEDAAFLLGKLSPVEASGINTPRPLRLSVENGSQLVSLDLVGTVDRLTGLPGAAAGFPPQQVYLALQGEGRDLAALRLTEELRVEPAGLEQIAELDIDKLDRLAELPEMPAAADLLRYLNGGLFASLDLKLPGKPAAGEAPMNPAGDLAAGLRIDLEGSKHLQVNVYGDLSDFDAHLPDGSGIEGLNLRLLFNRLYKIGERENTVPLRPRLSETVLDRVPGMASTAAPLLTERLRQDLRGVGGRERSLTFGRAWTRVAGFPIELNGGEGALQLDGPNPGITHLQLGLMGGSLKARAGLDLTTAVPRFGLFCSFSNLDTTRLLPETAAGTTGGASEITGELALQLPLLGDSRQLLEDLDLSLHFWQIGSRTLERALFALDPYEQNEAIIEQRKMLRLGSLRRLRVTAANGSLSTAGEIVAGGVGIELPRLDRLNLARLPLETVLSEPLKRLPPLLSLLDLAAADYLELGADGEIILRRTDTGE